MTDSVSVQLQIAIEASGASQAEIARQTGIDPGVLSRFVRNERGISDSTFSKLCEYLELELQPVYRKKA